jgi:hypothetical protein
VCAPRPFSVVCFRFVGEGAGSSSAVDDRNQVLLERVNATGELFISHAVLSGRYVLRLAVGQRSTTEVDIAHAWDVLRREAAAL